MKKYDHKEIERKWQLRWEKDGTFATQDDASKRKCFVLDMFPYPSGNGLHVGHPEGYTATDIVSRKRRMEGWNVLHPMGWDAFGLPAENYAIKTGVHPRESTWKNIDNFRRQLKMLGFSYDWSREINTADPSYYRWTQWLFLFLYKHDLAYKQKAPVNWCTSCQTVLANEQVVDGRCERCKSEVIQKNLEQWFFRVTKYADRLLEGLERVDWPERIKAMQVNWIGRSEGTEIVFRGTTHAAGGAGKDYSLTVFTTRPDTLFGVSYVVLAPEHPLVMELVAPDRRAEVEAYVKATQAKSELTRTGLEQEKSGVPLGANVVHPLTGATVPLWIADYVLANYGTGAVMGVPAHDDRDFAFAGKYGLPVTYVIAPPRDVAQARHDEGNEHAYTEPGYLVNSREFDGLTSDDAKNKITDALEAKSLGKRRVQYHLRDWLISRQRYWGAPIPIIYCETCGEVPVPEDRLPVLLPDDVDFRPTGESPLTRSVSFHEVNCPRCGKKARRESDTMDAFVDSSWYFLRFASPHEGERAFSSHAVNYWCPVDLYVGGAEHAVLHLMFARFFTKVLFDHGLVPFDEPFTKLRSQGLILGEDGQKMSKSRGNVINPDDVVAEHGADTLRLYEMFMGDFEAAKPWDTKGILGVRRFLDRSWVIVHDVVHQRRDSVSDALRRALHKTIKKVSSDIEACKFNTAISALMILLNDWYEQGGGDKEFCGAYLRLLSPFAPHLAEELWALIGNETSIALTPWPAHDEALVKDETVFLVVQVNGKVRDRIEADAGLEEEDAKAKAFASPKIAPLLEGKRILKTIVVRDKLVNIVLQ
ncbi:MAG TPA: leucine--tRNA ligase [Candidatus Binatia bacterium]|jgi:leucyl-tRNA synthetase|nr:leucine--tRNA ligase [Candidatus Binatia bacterium]